jgi:hypothetical protein
MINASGSRLFGFVRGSDPRREADQQRAHACLRPISVRVSTPAD